MSQTVEERAATLAQHAETLRSFPGRFRWNWNRLGARPIFKRIAEQAVNALYEIVQQAPGIQGYEYAPTAAGKIGLYFYDQRGWALLEIGPAGDPATLLWEHWDGSGAQVDTESLPTLTRRVARRFGG